MMPNAMTAMTAVTAVTAVAPVTPVTPVACANVGTGESGGAGSTARPSGEFARALDRAGAARAGTASVGAARAETAIAGAGRAGTARAEAARGHGCADTAKLACNDHLVGEDLAPDAGDTAAAGKPPQGDAGSDTEPPAAVIDEAGVAAQLLTQLHALRMSAPADAAAARAVAEAGTATSPAMPRLQAQGPGHGPGTYAAPAATVADDLPELKRGRLPAPDPTQAQTQMQAVVQSQSHVHAQERALEQGQRQTLVQPTAMPQASAPVPVPTSMPGLAEALPAAAIDPTPARPDAGSTPLTGPAHLPAPLSTAWAADGAATAEARLAAAPGSAEFGRQLGAQLTTFVREGVEHARLHLNPAELGPVTVRIRIDGDAAQVHLGVEHALTRQALEQSMPLLAGSLRDAGLTLSGGGVFEQPRQPGDGAPQTARGAAGDPRNADADPDPPLHAVAAGYRRRGVVDLVA